MGIIGAAQTDLAGKLVVSGDSDTQRFEMSLAAGEKKEIYFGYSVTYPRKLPVQGLE